MFYPEIFIIDRRAGIGCYRFNISETRSLPAPFHIRIQLFSRSFCFNINAPVRHITDKSFNPKSGGFSCCVPSEANSLYKSLYLNLVKQFLFFYHVNWSMASREQIPDCPVKYLINPSASCVPGSFPFPEA